MRILITGGTGSLGHALVQHYLAESDHRLIVFSRDEWKQAQMREAFPDPRLEFFLGDVRDQARLELAFSAVDVVIHAAALKRIDSTAHDPDEVFKTNVEGSRGVLHAARGRVKQCLLISSDKACYPTNAYGKSKAMAESLFTEFNVYSRPRGTVSGVVRYGNVLGSRGSVVPLWRSQIEQGLPLTLIPGMSRFLIAFPTAISLIETALTRMTGGEIFVPRLTACMIEDLAQAVKNLAGCPDHPVSSVSPRHGTEKLAETLLTEEECVNAIEEEGFVWVPPDGIVTEGVGLYGWRSDRAPMWSVDELTAIVQAHA